MWYPESMHRQAMRHGFGRSVFGRWTTFLLLCVALAIPGLSRAACPDTMSVPDANTTPSTSPMASGGSITIDLLSTCAPFGISGVTSRPTHGTTTTDNNAAKITYSNNGDGATTDTFQFDDGTPHIVTVTVHIAAATSPITIAPATMPSGTVAIAYPTQTLSASGGTSPYSFAVTSGALPNGLTLSGNTISGTPTTQGSYSFSITATDSASVTSTASYSITIGAPTVTITNTPANAVINAPYSFTLAASGGTAPYTYTLDGGTTLPPGLALASNGTISGTPTTLGTTNFTVRATDSSGSPGPYFSGTNLSITVQNLPPPVANPVSATIAYGSTNNPVTLNITGGAPASVAIGTQAAHGTATASGTSITYTPTAGYAGPDSFTYTATNSGGTSAPATATITVAPPTITYTPSNPAAATVGVAYSQSLAGASGGAAPYTYAIASGSLPAGITLASNGTLSGTPTANGTYNFTVRATDSSTGTGPFSALSGTLTLTVNAPTLSYAPTNPLPATVGVAYSRSVAGASGGTAPYTYTLASGSLPAGITLASNGTLSGTATAGGSYSFTLTATDSSGGSGPFSATSGSLTLTVNAPTITVAPASLPGANVGASYAQAVTASGGTSAYTYAVTAGALPAGLALASSGAITGTPTAAGTYNFTVTATDSSTGTGPYTGSRAYALTVAAPTLALTPASGTTISATAGSPVSATFSAADGTAPYNYTVVAGTLPPGVTLSAAGTLSGTPTAAGNFNFTVQASDSSTGTGAPFSVSGTYTLAVAAPTITLSPGSLPVPSVGTVYSQTISASEAGPTTFTYSVTAGLLPAGLHLDATTGALSGTPTAAGSFSFTLTATDSSGFTGSQSYSVTVGAGTVVLNPGALANAAAESPYTHTFAASGGTAPYTYALTAGALPAGMALSSSGVLSGTPTAAGTFNFTLTATDSSTGSGAPFTASQAYSLTVGAPTISVAPASLPSGSGGTAYSQTLTASGGNGSYTYSLTAGALPPGIALASSGLLSGTPTATGNYNFTVTATDGFGFTGSHAYTVTVGAPTIVFTPTTLPGGQVATAYNQSVSATGGSGSFTYSLTAGALPPGLALGSNGAITGTPTTAGNFSFTVTATDSFGFSGSQAYTVGINQPVPVAVNDTATTAANASATVAVTTNDTGPITSITVAQAPAHGTATVNGLDVAYAPATNFFGTDSFTYTATGPGGTSAPATVRVTVTALAVPVATAKSAKVLAGKSITIHAAAGATNGPFTAVTVVHQPTSGTVTTQGTDLIYTAEADASGTFGFDYTLSNVFGTSQPAHVTLTVDPRPVAPALKASSTAGTTVQVDLTTGARGGPFTGAAVVSVAPANAGSASISANAQGGYTMAFAAAPTFGGVARVTYTLSNAFATSEPGTVDITVKLRADPSKDAEVLGVLEAQAESARRMALGQISNFQRRLESLHHGGSTAGFSNGVTMNSAGDPHHAQTLSGMQQTMGGNGDPFLMPADAPAADQPAATGTAPGGLGVWAGGAMNFGKLQPGSSGNGIDFTTSGLSLGADKQVSRSLALGLGVGYGHDASDVGRHGSHSSVDSYNVAAYGSYQPGASAYVDALAGYQWLQFDARRFVADDGNTARGSRDGKQWFLSLSVGYQHQADDMLLTPYGRLDVARATLEGYTETGDQVFALSYGNQTVKTSTGTVGLLAQWTVKRDYGVWAPQLRAEFGHDMQGSSQAVMRYADTLSGPLYQATLSGQSRNHTLLGAGITLQTRKGWSLRAEYQNQLDNTSRDNQSILLGVQKALQP